MHNLALVVTVLAGCAHRGWHVYVPRQTAAVPLDSYLSLPVRAVAGGIKSGWVVDVVEARCADPSICEVRVAEPNDPDQPFRELQVLARREGDTDVVVDAENPVYHDRERHAFAVRVTGRPQREIVTLGGPLPARGDLVHRAGGADFGHCTAPPLGLASRVPGGERADVHLWACTPFAQVAGGRRFPTCDAGACAMPGSYVLCAQTRDGAIAATAMLDLHRFELPLLATEGTLDAGVCAR